MSHRIRLSSHLLVCAAALALATLPATARAQGPAQDALDNADEQASKTGPDTLNTVQQARMKLGEAERSVARGEKLDKKAASTKDPSDQKDLREKAQKAFEDGIAAYKAALQLDPDLTEAWVGLAGMMAKSGRFDLAIQTYDRALALDGDNAQALAGRGHAELAIFKVEEAKATYERLAAVDAKAGRKFIADMRSWLDATKPRLGPEMADAIAQLDAWIAEHEKS